jgi:hypothetical protein
MAKVIGVEKVQRKLNNIVIKVNKQFIPEVTKRTYVVARFLAPVDSGALRNAIRYAVLATKGQVILSQPNHYDGRMRPYHMWMHGIRTPSKDGRGYDTTKGRYAPKTGKLGPAFMWRAADAGRKLAAQLAAEMIRKAKK